jgi:creatinine amidohydrolase
VIHEWNQMTWTEVRQAASDGRVVLIPMGCVETQGPYTPVGFEFTLARRLATDVATRTGSVATPALPFGNSATFQRIPGSIPISPRVLAGLYHDVILAVCRSGFRRIVCIATHIPNQPLIEEAARLIRAETGVRAVWVNPGALAATYLKDLFADPVAARGHGAEPGLSLARHLYGTVVPEGAGTGERGVATYAGFEVKGPGMQFNDFPVGMPYFWEELFPESGGYGNPLLGNAEIGGKLYENLVEHVCGVVSVVQSMETDARDPLDARP